MMNSSDRSRPYGTDQPSYPAPPAPGSWPAQGAPSGSYPPGVPQQQPPNPGTPATQRTGLRSWHLVVAAVIALVLGGVGGFAGGFYGLGGGVTGSEAQELRDRVAELEGQVSDLEEELAAAGTGGDADSDAGSAGGGGGPVRIGVPVGWEEIAAASQVWVQAVEEAGYQTEIVELPEIAVLYSALANGEIDMAFGSWGSSNQQEVDRHGDDLEDLGSWFDDARMGIVVNEDAPITSLAELADHADEFNGEILGIEEGSGVVEMTNQAAVPAYGLDGMTVSTNSTEDMLLGIAEAMDAGENVAATLWSPHWVMDQLPVRFLEDPEGAFGEPESIHAYGTAGFAADQPELTECLSEISLTADQVNSMVHTVVGQAGRADPGAAQQWLTDNSDVVCDVFA